MSRKKTRVHSACKCSAPVGNVVQRAENWNSRFRRRVDHFLDDRLVVFFWEPADAEVVDCHFQTVVPVFLYPREHRVEFVGEGALATVWPSGRARFFKAFAVIDR